MKIKEPKISSPIKHEKEWGTAWEYERKDISEANKKSIRELRRLLCYKYKTVLGFCRATGFNKNVAYNIMYARYDNATLEKKIMEVVELTKQYDTPVDERRVKIDMDTQVWMKMRLYSKFRNVANFSRIYPEFSAPYLNHVMKGRKKYYCPRINRLIQILNSTYED